MLTNHEPDRNIEDLTDAEIYAAISYLEPDSSANEPNGNNGIVICVGLCLALLACLAYVWLYH